MKGGKSDIFNLGNGVGFSVREVIEKQKRLHRKILRLLKKAEEAAILLY